MINENEVIQETIEQINAKDSALAAELHDIVQDQLPDEKARAEREMAETHAALKAKGSSSVEGLGQAVGSIPPILFYRWQQLYPGCWRDRDFVNEFLADNPQCCAPGYKPPAKTVYFDMGGGSKPGATSYHLNRARVENDAKAISDRIFKMTGLKLAAA